MLSGAYRSAIAFHVLISRPDHIVSDDDRAGIELEMGQGLSFAAVAAVALTLVALIALWSFTLRELAGIGVALEKWMGR